MGVSGLRLELVACASRIDGQEGPRLRFVPRQDVLLLRQKAKKTMR